MRLEDIYDKEQKPQQEEEWNDEALAFFEADVMAALEAGFEPEDVDIPMSLRDGEEQHISVRGSDGRFHPWDPAANARGALVPAKRGRDGKKQQQFSSALKMKGFGGTGEPDREAPPVGNSKGLERLYTKGG